MAEEHRIELIPREIEEARKRAVLVRSLRVLGLGLLTLTVMVTAALFSVVQAQKSSLRNIQQQVAAKKAALADLADTEIKVAGLTDKTKALIYIFDNRNYYSLLLEALSKGTPAGVSITDLTAASTGEISLTGEVLDYTSLANFLRDMVDPEKGGSLFTEVGLTSVSFNPSTGTAQFTAEAEVVKNGLRGGWESLLEEGWESFLEYLE